MNEFPKELTALHAALKASKAAKYFIKSILCQTLIG